MKQVLSKYASQIYFHLQSFENVFFLSWKVCLSETQGSSSSRYDINPPCSRSVSEAYCTLQWCLQPCGLLTVTPVTPITLQQLRGIHSLGKRGKKTQGREGGGEKRVRRVCVGWKGYKNKARIQKQSLPLKENNRASRSRRVRRERKKGGKKKRKRKWGRLWTVVGWGPGSRLRFPLPPSLTQSPTLTQQNPPQAQPHQERLATL